MSSVLVGLDGSRAARVAFHAAVQEAQWRSASLIVFHSVFVPMVLGKRLSLETAEQLDEYGMFVLDQELHVLAEAYDGTVPVDVRRVVWPGHIGEGLISIAHEPDNEVELVVLGTRGLGGFGSLLLGSVTSYAVHHLRVPMLIVPIDAMDIEPDEELSVL